MLVIKTKLHFTPIILQAKNVILFSDPLCLTNISFYGLNKLWSL